jgi:hypothetical protein
MSVASPLGELIVHFRKHARIPDEWVRRFSARGDLDEAAAHAWQTERNATRMALLAAYFADRRALALVAVDFGRMLLGYLPDEQQQISETALDYVEKWATVPGTPAPKAGWLAVADSTEPEELHDDLPGYAACTIVTAITVPECPLALRSLAEGVVSRKVEEIREAEGGSRARRTEEQVEAIEQRAAAAMWPAMVECIRAHIPAPSGETLREALAGLREKELATAFERKNASTLKAFRPD